MVAIDVSRQVVTYNYDVETDEMVVTRNGEKEMLVSRPQTTSINENVTTQHKSRGDIARRKKNYGIHSIIMACDT